MIMASRARKEIRHERKYLTVRMAETRMVFFDARNNPTRLDRGKTYALPAEFARYLVWNKRAVMVGGKLKTGCGQLREIAVPAVPRMTCKGD